MSQPEQSGRSEAQRQRGAFGIALVFALLLLACNGKKTAPASTVAAKDTGTASSATAASGGAVTAASPAVARAGGTTTTLQGAQAVTAATPAPRAQTASRVESVKLVVDVLLDRYYKPLKSSDLLGAAWKGVTDAAKGGSTGVTAPKLTGNRADDWSAFNGQYAQLFTRLNGSVSGTVLSFGAIQGMVDSLHDDHTYFLNPDENKQRQASDRGGGSFVGIGITLGQRAPFLVTSVIAGAPAALAGVKPGDAIINIDGQDVTSAGLQGVRQLLQGAAGSSVALRLRHAGGVTQDVVVQRAEIIQPALESAVLPGGIGYIVLHGFADADARYAGGLNIEQTLDAALQSFEQQGVKGWIFDVRGNPGGSSQTLAEVAGRFQPTGNVLWSKDRNGVLTAEPVDGHLFAVQRPLALLINGESGSSSELLAAALQEYGRARLVGQRTAGAVNGGLVVELPDGAALQYTVVEALSGKDRKPLDNNGVVPDDAISGRGDPSTILSGGSDPQFERAKSWVLDQAAKQPTLMLTPPAAGDALAAAQVESTLKPFAPALADLPADITQGVAGFLVENHPNEPAIGIAGDTTDPGKFADNLRARHWQGSYLTFFGDGAPQPFIISIDLYRDGAGAHTALITNDFDTALKSAAPPAKLGDETVAYQGFASADGSAQVVWRRGRLVFTVQYTADPGQGSLGPALAVAQTVDRRAASQVQP